MNKVMLLGHLTRDIEVRHGQSGLAIGKSGIAVNRKTKAQSGEMRDETMFVDFTVFGGAADTIGRYFKRGSKILIEGRLQFDQWTDQNGGKRSKHSVVVESFYFPESKASAQQNNGNFNNNGGGYNNNYNQNQGSYQNQNSGNGSWNGNNNTPNGNNQNSQQNSGKQKEEPVIDINGDMDGNVPF
ncbi:single stranded DNA-binding protein [Thiovulum sp. ES]|nr:single stranded DNA-binding protein [Thiovulum sp. ES]